MSNFAIKPKMFFDEMGSVQPSQPQVFDYGDRPEYTFSFLPGVIHEGDLLVFAVDNDMTFYDSAPENILHSATCMVVNRHEVTAAEASAGSVTMTVDTRTVKFRDVVNGKVRPVDVVVGLYLKTGSDASINYALLAKGRGFANGIIADYDALPEPITTEEYYTKDEIDGKLADKADESDLTSHTGDTDIHVTLQDKTAWDSKADVQDIGTAKVTITQGGVSKGAFSVNATEDVTIDVNDGAQTDWNEADPQSAAYLKNKPSIYTQTETDNLLSGKADKSTTYTKSETDTLLGSKADVATTLAGYGITDAYTKTETDTALGSKADSATTLAGYGITDAYTKTEVDTKLTTVYKYCGTVSTYGDLPVTGMSIGDVYNVETADAQHGVNAGDNVCWTGTAWDVLAGTVDLSGYLEKPSAAGTVGQVLTATASGQEWADVPTELPAGGSAGQVLTKTATGEEWADAPKGSDDYFYLTQDVSPFSGTNTIRLNKIVTDYAPADINLEYSFDKTTWTQYGWQGNTGDEISISGYTKVYFRGNNATISPSDATHGYYQFVFTGSKIIKAGGNLMSLLDKKCEASSLQRYCFRYLFKDCTLLTIPPSIKAVHFNDGCKSMFQGCTNLQSIVPMPEDADGEFNGMYANCTSLTNVKLSVKNAFNHCFASMFENCTSLKTVEVKADVFYALACSNMFAGCTALEKAVLGIYKTNMSGGYTQLFDRMFFGCTNLKKVRLLNSLFPVNSGDWLKNASEYGVFVCPSNTSIPATRDTSGVPVGWTIAYTDAGAVSGAVISVEDSTDATAELSPSGEVAKHITVASALTLSATAVDSGSIAYAEVVLDIASGATVTAGTNLTFKDAPVAGKRNICEVRWSDGAAKLRIKYLEDLPVESSSSEESSSSN